MHDIILRVREGVSMGKRKQWPSTKERKNSKNRKKRGSKVAQSYVQINLAITVKTGVEIKSILEDPIEDAMQDSPTTMNAQLQKSILKTNTIHTKKSIANNRHVKFRNKLTHHDTYSVTDGLYFRSQFIQSVACATNSNAGMIEFVDSLPDDFTFRQLEPKAKTISIDSFPMVSIKQEKQLLRKRKLRLLENKDTEELGLLDDVLQYQILSFHLMEWLTSRWKIEMELMPDDHQLAAEQVSSVRHPYKPEQILDQNLLQTSMFSLDFVQKISALRQQYMAKLQRTHFTLIDYTDPMEALALAKVNDEQFLRSEIDQVQNAAVAAVKGLRVSKKKQELLDIEKSQLYLKQEKLFAEFYNIPFNDLEIKEDDSKLVDQSSAVLKRM